jgi:hypothetical protein
VVKRADGILAEPSPDGGARVSATRPRSIASRATSPALQRLRGTP